MLEICIQTSYDQNVQLILESYHPVVYGTPLSIACSLQNFEDYLDITISSGAAMHL
jgi:hypothetical protein